MRFFSLIGLLLGATSLQPALAVSAPAGLAPGEKAPAFTPVSAAEHARTIEAMKPPKRKRPVVAVIGNNTGAETTDFLVPYGVLTESGTADVLAVAPSSEPIRLRPSLKIKPQATLAEFDTRYPDGADYVIVPAMQASPEVIAWLQAQARGGATIVAICAGAMTLSEAGLLKDRAATTYWLSRDQLRKDNPGMRWIPNRRYVADRGIVTTTGITASMPVSLALVEAIAGRTKAEEVGRRLGMTTWDGNHDSNAFGEAEIAVADAQMKTDMAQRPEAIGLAITPGMDEIAMAFVADAFSRPGGVITVTTADSDAPIQTKRGLTILPDRTPSGKLPGRAIPAIDMSRPAATLDLSLAKIEEMFGKDAARKVAMSMEYPRGSFVH